MVAIPRYMLNPFAQGLKSHFQFKIRMFQTYYMAYALPPFGTTQFFFPSELQWMKLGGPKIQSSKMNGVIHLWGLMTENDQDLQDRPEYECVGSDVSAVKTRTERNYPKHFRLNICHNYNTFD